MLAGCQINKWMGADQKSPLVQTSGDLLSKIDEDPFMTLDINFGTGITLEVKWPETLVLQINWDTEGNMTPKSIQQVGHKARLEHGSSVFQPRCLSRCCHKWKSLRLWTKWTDLRSWPENHLSNQVPSVTLLHFLILPLPNKASFF